MNALIWLGVVLVVLWLVLWLAIKITFAAIHLIVLTGVILLIVGIVNAARAV
jgi:hypothetical protein